MFRQIQLLFLGACAALVPPRGLAAGTEPVERLDQAWKVVPLAAAGGLTRANIFNLDFEPDGTGSRKGTAWIATSDGLREYDGYTWKRHGQAQGLPSDFVRAVLRTRAGDLWVGTDRGAGIYDGKTFRTLGSETNLAGPNVRRIIEDATGTVWFCSDSWPSADATGGLTSYRAGKWRAYHQADGLPDEYVVNFLRDSSGRDLAVTLSGLAQREGERWRTILRPHGDGELDWGSACLVESPATGAVLSTGASVLVRNGAGWREFLGVQRHAHGLCATRDGRIVASGILASGHGAVAEWRGTNWATVSAPYVIPNGYTEDIREAPDGSIWVAGFGCLVRWERQASRQHEFPDIPGPLLEDSRGGIWFARTRGKSTAPGDLLRFADGRWENLPTRLDELLEDRAGGVVWGWNGDHVSRWRGTNEVRYPPAVTGLASPLAGRIDGTGRLWLAGEGPDGKPAVSVFEHGGWKPRDASALRGFDLWRQTAAATADGLWIGGDHGQGTDATLFLVSDRATERIPLPGALFGRFGANLHSGRDGSVWVYGDSGLYRWTPGRSREWDAFHSLPARQVVSCVERGDDLWFGCREATGGEGGIIRFRNGDWTVFPVQSSGRLRLAADGSITCGGFGRFWKIGNSPDAVPVAVDLPAPERVTEVLKARDGSCWMDFGDGVMRFQPDGEPPDTRITGPSSLVQGDVLAAEARSVERFHPESARGDWLFSWKLDGGGWTAPAASGAGTFPTQSLSTGHHRIEVRCIDGTDLADPTPAALDFIIGSRPMQERPWFMPSLLGLAGVMSGLALLAARARRQLADMVATLEVKVAERTAALEADMRRRRQIEEELRHHEEVLSERLRLQSRLATVAASVPGALFAFRVRPDGSMHFPEASPRFLEVLGVRPEDAEQDAAAVFSVVHPDDLARFRGTVADAVRQVVPWQDVFQVIHPGRGVLWIEVSAHPAAAGDGRPVWHGILLDVTARRRLEIRHTTEHAVARVLAEATSLAGATPALLQALCESEGWQYGELWTVDDADGNLACLEVWHGGGPEFRDLEAQTRSMRFHLGEGLVGGTWKSGTPVLVPALEADGGFLRKRTAANAGQRSAVAFPIRTTDRITGVMAFMSSRPEQPDAALFEMLTTIGMQVGQFIARKTAQEELRRFVAISPATLYALRITPSGTSCYWVSENVVSLTGYTAEEAMRKSWWAENLHPDDRERLLADDRRIGESDNQVVEFRFRRKDGTHFWVRDEKRLLRAPSGAPLEVIGAWTDITQRRALEAQLRQSQKMEAIGQLSGGIAHDFNNILGSIIANAQLGAMDLPPDDAAAGHLSEILRAARRAANLVRQILTFARQDSQEKRRIGIGPVVEETVRLLRATLPAGVELACSVAADLPPVVADETQVQQVVLNLGTNAWHALKGGAGRIRVALEPVLVDEAFAGQNPALKAGPHVRLRVQDDGSGMDAATLERIFEPFFTTKDPGHGTGLGLSVVHGIVQSHSGAVVVESAPGVGSTFDIYLPAAAGERVMPPATAGVPRRGDGQRILLVDDEEALLRISKRVIERLGYRVTACPGPGSALECFAAEPDAWALVLCDFNMPGKSGLDLARELLARRPGLPVLLTSGDISAEVRTAAGQAGVRGIVRKPASVEELSQAIQRGLLPDAAPEASKA